MLIVLLLKKWVFHVIYKTVGNSDGFIVKNFSLVRYNFPMLFQNIFVANLPSQNQFGAMLCHTLIGSNNMVCQDCHVYVL